MVIRSFFSTVLLLLGSFCIQNAAGKSIFPPNYDASFYEDRTPASVPFLDVGFGTDVKLDGGLGYADLSPGSFSEILCCQLMENTAFRDLFSVQISVDLALTIGSSIAQALVTEIGLRDRNFVSNLLTSTLIRMNPGAGPEDFARCFAYSIAPMLSKNGLLNVENEYSLACRISRIIINSISGSFLGVEASVGAGANVGLGVGGLLGTGAGLGAWTGLNSNAGLNLGADLGFDASLGAVAGGNLGSSSRFGAGAGLEAGAGLIAGLGLGTGAHSDWRANTGLETGLGLGASLGLEAGIGLEAGLTAGAGIEYNSDLGTGADLGIGASLGAGVDLRAGLGFETNAELGLGLGLAVGSGIGTNLANEAKFGLDLDLEVSADVILLFKSELTKELLKDKFFRYIFSDSLPRSALSAVAGAMAQYLSKAFGLPRSTFLPLEKNILTMTNEQTLTLEAYAGIIVTTLVNILIEANIIINSAVKLQIAVALTAISSGISNFLGIYSIPGVSISSNSYNSFFSVLNGLEKLPYVGTDAVSRKFPPFLNTAKATLFALRFIKLLFCNLISSRRFYESFSLGVPASAYKTIANTLGNFMADAFGSPSPSIFSNNYANALLVTKNKLNYKIYARILSEATAKSLFSLGYFLSGNVNIQAAIATNAIIRGLVTICQQKPPFTQVTLFPGIFNIPWITQLTGVAPPESLLKVKADVGVDANLDLGLRADVDLGASVGIDAGFSAKSNVAVGANARFKASAGARLEEQNSLLDKYLDPEEFALLLDKFPDIDADASGNIRTQAGVEAQAAVRADAGVQAGLGVGSVVSTDVGVNAGLSFAAGANVGAAVGITAGIGGNVQLSILNVLPQLLANKLYRSTALYTAYIMVGTRKVISLIAQGMAAEFGFSVAALFLKSYDTNFGNNEVNSYGPFIIALASATTDALTASGILNASFTMLAAIQLSDAIVAKYSSLIATSLEARDWNLKSKCTNIYDPDQFDPVLGTENCAR